MDNMTNIGEIIERHYKVASDKSRCALTVSPRQVWVEMSFVGVTSGEYVTLRAFMDAPPGESIVYRGAKLTMNGGME